jgi:hypothetical protein
MSSQQKYLEEYERHKHIVIEAGEYHVKSRLYLKYSVLNVDLEKELVLLERNGSQITKTLHWCRKKLVKIR